MQPSFVVHSLSHVWLLAVPWTATHQAFLYFTISQSLLEFMSIESVIQTSHPLSLPSPPVLNLSEHQGFFPMNWLFSSSGHKFGASTSASVLPVNIQDWFPLGWTGLISLQSKDSQESSLTPHFKSFNSSVCSLLYGPTHTHKWLLEKP